MANKKPTDAAGAVETNEVENSSANTNEAEYGDSGKPEGVVNTTKYSVDEFVAAANSVFNGEFHPDIIKTALKLAGVKEATIDEAKTIIKEFAYKEVTE